MGFLDSMENKLSRIALVTETWPPEINGVAMTLSRLVEGILKRDWDVTLIRPVQEEKVEIQIAVKEILVTGMPLPGYDSLRFGFPAFRVLYNLWSRSRPALVHIVTEGPLGFAALVVARHLKIPVITSFHTNFHSYCRHYRLNWLRKIAAFYLRHFHNASALTLLPAESMRQSFVESGYRNLEVLGRGVDTHLFSPHRRDHDLRMSWGVHEEDLVALYVGRMAPEKNLEMVAKAFSALKLVNLSARMVWVGDGPELAHMAHAHPDHIFLGARTGEELARCYASADIFIFPSMTETYGNVIVEAMSSGLAVVAYDYAAAGLNIQHGENGLLVAFGNNQLLLQMVTQLGRSPELSRNLGRNARISVERKGWSPIVDRYECLMRHVINSSSAGD